MKFWGIGTHTTAKSHAKCDTVVLPVFEPNKVTNPIVLTRKQSDPGSKAETLYYTTSRAHLEGACTHWGQIRAWQIFSCWYSGGTGLLLGREISDRCMAELVAAATTALRVGLRRVRPVSGYPQAVVKLLRKWMAPVHRIADFIRGKSSKDCELEEGFKLCIIIFIDRHHLGL